MSRYKRSDAAFKQHLCRLADLRRRYCVPFWLYMVVKVIFLARVVLRLVGAL